MLLHKDGLIELNYDVVHDILKVNWPDLTGATMPEINYSLKKLIDTLRHFDIKRLMVDSRGSSVADISREDHQAIIFNFAKKLMSTRLEKMARIETKDNARETVVVQTAEEAIHNLGIQYQFRNFSDELSAYKWLCEN
ncbi:hypothetical protein H8S95_11810 [Pontibacter sp. KCTC 32443]|uniref:hypothetical protein n=1 Tax=Pontibacter TaxID=323449 RepID=UPI00164EA350|nr:MULTISPECIES: hypothetical protein [Pontibacter]MBC5774751.1 hypothetical protein [Pontibacter sp. KCTC 32443]